MVTDTARLRAAVFEQTGIAIDEKDPIMAVIAACAHQTDEIGTRLLRRTNPVRTVISLSIAALAFSGISSFATWQLAQSRAQLDRSEWLRQQSEPRLAALMRSPEGRAAIELAELGIAGFLAKCSGRSSWRIRDGYCIPMTADGRPDGFRVHPTKPPRS